MLSRPHRQLRHSVALLRTGSRGRGKARGTGHGRRGVAPAMGTMGEAHRNRLVAHTLYEKIRQWTQPSQPLGWGSRGFQGAQGFQGTQGRVYSSSGGVEDEVEAVRRELEELKMRLAQQERHGDATNMVMMVPKVDTSVNTGGYHQNQASPSTPTRRTVPATWGSCLPTTTLTWMEMACGRAKHHLWDQGGQKILAAYR